jgi:formate dehydrogenase major subunit
LDANIKLSAKTIAVGLWLDPFGKIPEFKYCAVQVTKGGQVAQVMGYGTNDPKRQKLVTTS